jgi:pimeloyl-ACP methyl ester carboxylesterase
VSGVALGAALLASSSCGSLDKQTLEDRLLARPKNKPLGELGLRRTVLRLPEAGAPHADNGGEPLALVHLFAPAREPDPARLPLVLVHGTPSTLFCWSELVAGGADFEGLAARRDVHLIEVLGHGLAPTEPSPHSFERCARYVGAALRALDLERVHLVGHSYGGEFCWRAALNDPDRIASLTLMSSSGFTRRPGDWLPEEEAMRESALAKLGWRLNSRERIAKALRPHYRAIPPDRVEEMYLVASNAGNWKAMVDLARDENGTREDELRSLGVPTLVLWGADDVAYPLDVYGRRFASTIPVAELAVVDGTGHYAHEERPAAVLAELERFLDAREQAP